MRYFKLLINYIVLFTIPFWGPVIVLFHNNRLSAWNSSEQLFERAKELGVCIVAPFAMVLFLLLIRFIRVSGFNAKLEPKDQVDTNSIQNIYESYRYGNYWAWQTFPESYDVEQERKQMMKECYNSLNKMSIIIRSRPLITKDILK